MPRLLIVLPIAALFAVSLGSAAAPQALDTPAPAGSFAPQLARAADGSVLLSWLESPSAKEHRFRAARLRNGAWEPAMTIAEGVEFFANWADVPSVSEHGGMLFAHWLQKSGAGTYAYDVAVRASQDHGRTWGKPFIAHSDRSPSEHGFASFFTRPDGKPGLAWLDGRETGGGGHSGHGAGAMTLRAAAIGATGTSGEALLDGRVCDCCPTAAVSTPGASIVAYRDRSTEEVRDISVVRLASGVWSKPVTLKDNWKISGCPVNGPALAARGARVALAWFTGADNKPSVKVAHSSDGGRTWGTPVTLSSGIPLGRVAAAITSDQATHIAWLDHNDGDGRVLLRRIAASGAAGEAQTLTAMKTDRNSGYPRMIADGNGLVFAWTEIGADRTKRVRIARRN
ncbi:MAG: glycoside hydrolase [Acidobacteriota bacterium]|nr:glycoside hydrolase [Acidobacteriota bacterium]